MSSNWRLEAISNAAKKRKKSSFVLKVGENKVGKREAAQIRINSLLCSREHCTIFLEDDKITLQDFVSIKYIRRPLICIEMANCMKKIH